MTTGRFGGNGDTNFNNRFGSIFCQSCQANVHYCLGNLLTTDPSGNVTNRIYCECPNTECVERRTNQHGKKVSSKAVKIGGSIAVTIGRSLGKGLWHMTDPPWVREGISKLEYLERMKKLEDKK